MDTNVNSNVWIANFIVGPSGIRVAGQVMRYCTPSNGINVIVDFASL